MINKKVGVTAGAILAGVLVFGAAAPAMAASQSGTKTCSPSGSWVAQLDSDTTGATRHAWTDASSGAQKHTDFASGGLHRTLGYKNSQWVLTASTIASFSATCVN